MTVRRTYVWQNKVMSNQRACDVTPMPNSCSQPAILPSLGTTRSVSLTAKPQVSAKPRQLSSQSRHQKASSTGDESFPTLYDEFTLILMKLVNCNVKNCYANKPISNSIRNKTVCWKWQIYLFFNTVGAVLITIFYISVFKLLDCLFSIWYAFTF